MTVKKLTVVAGPPIVKKLTFKKFQKGVDSYGVICYNYTCQGERKW